MRLLAIPQRVLSMGTNRMFHLSRIHKSKVLYDGECPICMIEINFLKKYFNKEGKVEFVDITKGSYKPEDHSGVTYQEAIGNMHVIGENNQVYKKMDGIREMYRGVGLKGFAKFTEMPVIRPVSDRMYDIFAANRFRLTGRQDNCNCQKQ
ncbi:uncharacterized protein LOC125646476 isoform X2 [Ostrea edulis]|uniref:uncharacterized protein LOC125646476 isoform X2 n=1 Tax=Ostrea edulis TaxID=37623 RepID=UPI00209471FC|nr:uncharacterized protein LOC125646476 isoform X2 [Ostrea edulis]